MKIIDFQPGIYRNLPPRAIHFTREMKTAPLVDGCSIRFLVGRNGTGKTNILRFLASIFLALEEDYRRPRPNNPAYTIPYQLTYELHGSTIMIDSTGKGRSGVTVTVDGRTLEAGEFPGRDQMLPTYVLVYTSGDYKDWHSLFTPSIIEDKDNESDAQKDVLRVHDEYSPHQIISMAQAETTETDISSSVSASADKLSLADTIDEPRNIHRVTLASASQLKFALLAALLNHQYQNRVKSALHDGLAEVNVRLVAFSLQVHPSNNLQLYRREIDSLSKIATRRVQRWEDQLWVYDLNEIDILSGNKKIQQVAEIQPPFTFYQTLCNLYASGLLRDANLIIEYTPDSRSGQSKRTLLSDDLSDGEFAFISRMALIYLLNEKDCLFLFDEPEVHFNDDWKRNLVDSIEQALTFPEKTESEIILTTHASIVLTDAFPYEVILMTFAGQQIPPRTLGGEPGELLQSILGASQTVGKRAVRKIQAALETKDRATLEAMLKHVGPGYYRFTLIEELQSVSLPKKD